MFLESPLIFTRLGTKLRNFHLNPVEIWEALRRYAQNHGDIDLEDQAS